MSEFLIDVFEPGAGLSEQREVSLSHCLKSIEFIESQVPLLANNGRIVPLSVNNFHQILLDFFQLIMFRLILILLESLLTALRLESVVSIFGELVTKLLWR